MSDDWSMFGCTPDQSHPEKSEPKSNNWAPEQGSFESFIIVWVGHIRVLEILVPKFFVVWKAKSFWWEIVPRAVLHAGTSLNYKDHLQRSHMGHWNRLTIHHYMRLHLHLLSILQRKFDQRLLHLRTRVPLFHIQQATINMVRAKIAPITVQQTSVDFRFLSWIGNCPEWVTFSSNI